MLFEKVLVPVDLSDVSERQVEYAIGLKDYGLKEAVLFFAVDVGDKPDPEESLKLDKFAAMFVSAGINVKVVAEAGKPSAMILKQAKKEKATMVLVSSSGKTKAQELVLGSVSLEVVRRTKVPVLVGKFASDESEKEHGRTRPLDQVLISLDLGPGTRSMMKVFKEMDVAGCKKAVLFHVVKSAKYSVEDDLKFKEVKDSLVKWKDEHKGRCEVDTHLHYGTPAYNVLEAAREFDSTLIVMGNIGKGLFHSMTLGSVSDEVLRKSSISVLIVPIS